MLPSRLFPSLERNRQMESAEMVLLSRRGVALAAGFLAFACACKNGATSLPSGAQAQEPAKTSPAPASAAPSSSGGGDARALMPRADLRDLSPEQLATFREVASDTFDYAGCNSTLAACLRADVKDKHAPRMARLAALLIKDGLSGPQVVDHLERYYASFPKDKRAFLKSDDCATLGPDKAPVTMIEYSDFQCPHCAVAARWLHSVIESAEGQARLCSKYFPLPQHPRAAIAAACAEYARNKGKFWPLSALFFEHQEELGDEELKSYAKQVGLNGAEMLQQAYAGKFQAAVDKHVAEATAANLHATPTFYLNGRQLTLPPKAEYILFSIQDEVEWTKGGSAWEKE